MATVNKAVASLKAFFSVAVRKLRYIPHNPFAGFKLQKVADKGVRYVTRDEFRSLLDAAGRRQDNTLWWQALIAVCYTGGTRLNEATNLQWRDIDFEADTLSIVAKRGVGDLRWTPKDGDARVVPIPKLTVDLLTQLQATADEGNPYVFLSAERVATIRAAMQAGTWVANSHVANNLRRRWLAIVKAAGIRHATIHDLRRSAITNWARALPIKVTKELAGHASIETTDTYYLAVTEQDLNMARRACADGLLTDAQ